MSIEVWEKTGRKKSGKSNQQTWLARGSSDEQAVRDALLAELPTTYLGTQFEGYDLDEIGDELWEATARYAEPPLMDKPDPPGAAGEFRFSFDATGGTFHVTEALEQWCYGPTEIRDMVGKSIGVSKNGVEGADLFIPGMQFELAYRHEMLDLDLAYVHTLRALRGKWNDAPFYGFDTHELLFLGGRGSQSTKADPEVTYLFLEDPNLASFDVGGITVSDGKKGHQYLWCYYSQEEDAAALQLTQKPKAVFLADVYGPGDFSLLGIGTGP